MNATPQIPPTSDWKDVRESLAGSFTARARGLLADTFVVQKNGSEFGRLTFNGPRGAIFTAGTLKATIERKSDGRYALFSEKARILTASPQTSSLDALEIRCGEISYPARISFLRNEATAFSPGDGETVLLEGNVTGRRYEATLDETDVAALPMALLLLYHTATLRRRAYVT